MIVVGWSAATPQPTQNTIFVNQLSYRVRVVFGSALAFDSTGDGRADTVGVDMTGDGRMDKPGVAMDTTGDGAADAVGIDTTGDGLVDSYVDLLTGDASGEYKARVRLLPTGELQADFPRREVLTLEVLMEAIEAWGEQSAAAQAAALPWSTEHDFEVVQATIGSISATPQPLMVDANGDGLADVEKTLWLMPAGVAPLGSLLAAAGDQCAVSVKVSVTQAAPGVGVDADADAGVATADAACCSVM